MARTHSAGGIVLNSRGEIALVQNGTESEWWGFPKGHIDEGERALAAARREIAEETGLTELALVKELPVYERFRGGPDGKDDESELKVIHMYVFTTTQNELRPVDPQNPEARWVRKDDIEKMLAHPKDKAFFSAIAGEL